MCDTIDRSKCKVFSVNGRWILAPTERVAKQVYVDNYGRECALNVRRVTSGFNMSYQGEPPKEVSEESFIAYIDVWGKINGGGVVSEDD